MSPKYVSEICSQNLSSRNTSPKICHKNMSAKSLSETRTCSPKYEIKRTLSPIFSTKIFLQNFPQIMPPKVVSNIYHQSWFPKYVTEVCNKCHKISHQNMSPKYFTKLCHGNMTLQCVTKTCYRKMSRKYVTDIRYQHLSP